MVASELTVRLAHHFGPYIATDPALLSETTSICTHYAVSPEDLFYKWEAFAFNHKLPKSEPLTVDHARELRKIVAASVNTASTDATSTPLKPSAALNRAKVAPDLNAMLGIKGTPSKGGPSAFQTPVRAATSGSPFAQAATPTASAYRPAVSARAVETDVVMSDIDSPSRASSAAGAASSKPAFSVLESLNEHLELSGSGSQLAPPPQAGKKVATRVSLAMATDPKAWNYRYMFEKKDERSQVLDDRIDEYASLLRSAYALDDEELGDPSLPSQEPIWVVGRICPALPAPESSAGMAVRAKATLRTGGEEDAFALPKLAETGVVLESSRMMGSGNRTPLVFARGCIVRHTPQDPGTGGGATTLSLFPGQMVLCKGINAGADKFSVSEICFPPPLPLAVHTQDEALDHSYAPHKLNGAALNILVAAGPFTSEHDLDFKPWHALMDQLDAGGIPCAQGRRGVPDTLILMGPFVSADHPAVALSTEMPEEIFAKHFSTRIGELVGKYAVSVVLVPSTGDLLNVHSAYPQPGFDKEEAVQWGLPKQRVRCLPNPSTFYINELVVGATTADSLGDIKAEEMVTRIEASPNITVVPTEAVAARNKETNTRWSRAVLSQRSFYPLYPPPTSARLAYDTSHSHLLNFPAVSPDLLLLPSTKIAKPFIRVVASSTIVQPASLAAGSLASIHINPFPKDQLDKQATLNANLYDRARIDLITI